MIDLHEEVSDLNFITEGELVEIMGEGKSYSLPYMCVLRHQDKRVFELVRSPADEDTSSNRLMLNQSRKNPDSNFSRFKVNKASNNDYQNWHYNYFGKNRILHSL